MAVAGITESSQYLTFTLDEELFALEIAKVREVLEFTTVTKVPRTPEFMRGVINLRGNVVPVVDLRLKFGMSRTEKCISTCVIIVEVEIDGESTILGALADSVQEVLELEPQQIDPPPRIGTRLDTTFIKGMGKRDDRFIILLNVDRVFTAEELELVQEAGELSSARPSRAEAAAVAFVNGAI
ncbi:MAG: purine-binding chemotaxis protein CheW [Deltaproteobacteria bacterium]|nr:purine-binding chemotaxis protein CheW [Deltaproteobacteria bacterium]